MTGWCLVIWAVIWHLFYLCCTHFKLYCEDRIINFFTGFLKVCQCVTLSRCFKHKTYFCELKGVFELFHWWRMISTATRKTLVVQFLLLQSGSQELWSWNATLQGSIKSVNEETSLIHLQSFISLHQAVCQPNSSAHWETQMNICSWFYYNSDFCTPSSSISITAPVFLYFCPSSNCPNILQTVSWKKKKKTIKVKYVTLLWPNALKEVDSSYIRLVTAKQPKSYPPVNDNNFVSYYILALQQVYGHVLS